MKNLALSAALALSAFFSTSALATDVPLAITQAQAFQELGRSCGGIKINEYAAGFNTAGLPTADAYLWTRCGGSGRGGGYHSTTYAVWVKLTWDLGGVLVSAEHEDEPANGGDVLATFSFGGYSERTQTGTFSPAPGTQYVYSTAILGTP